MHVRKYNPFGYFHNLHRLPCKSTNKMLSKSPKSRHMLIMHQSIPSTNIPPRATPGVLYSTAPPGPGFILDDLPRGPGFCVSIKLRLVQWKSILSLNWHLDHTSMRFIGSSDFNIKTIKTFGLKAYACTSTRRSIYIVKVIESITPFRLSP